MKLYKYTFSDYSVIIDDICAIKAVQHQYCNPGIELLDVEVYRVG